MEKATKVRRSIWSLVFRVVTLKLELETRNSNLRREWKNGKCKYLIGPPNARLVVDMIRYGSQIGPGILLFSAGGSRIPRKMLRSAVANANDLRKATLSLIRTILGEGRVLERGPQKPAALATGSARKIVREQRHFVM